MHRYDILPFLANGEAVLTGSHFAYTSGKHGPAYINMRAVAHEAESLGAIGSLLGAVLHPYQVDLVIGPETLGRNLAPFAAANLGVPGTWCDIVETDGVKRASFSPKLNFDRLVEGKRVGIVDDLLTTGSSVKLVADLVREAGGIPVVAAVVVRRTADVTAADCGTEKLEVLADVPGFEVLTQEECEAHGPCSKRVPMVLRPGHGWK